MKRYQQILSLVLTAVLLLTFTLTGCGSAPAASGSEKPANGETRMVTDILGREVEVPASVERIVPLGNTPRMITYLGLADKVVGIGECEIAESPIMAYAYINKDKWEGLPNCGTDAMGETAFYAESIIEADPDVILCSYAPDVVENIEKQTGKPVVAVVDGTLFGDDYDESLRILGETCGVEDRAEEVISFIDAALEDLEDRTKDVADDDKPSVLAAAATFKGSHGIEGVNSNYPIFTTISANEVSIDIADEPQALLVDREQILDWNPDMIFFDFSGVELVQIDFDENPDYYGHLKAYNDGNLYQWPNSTWHWSNVEIPIVTAYYLGTLLYPEQFDNVDFEAKASEIFDFFLGAPDYLSELEAVGAGYQKVTLGE